MKKILTIAATSILALGLAACGEDADVPISTTTTSETGVEITSEETTISETTTEETTTSAVASIATATEVSDPSPKPLAPAGAPTVAEAMGYQYVETATSGLNIYQEPGTDNYHLCIMYGEAPGYEFITDTGCSEAMSYDGLINAMMASWDTAIAGLDTPTPPA